MQITRLRFKIKSALLILGLAVSLIVVFLYLKPDLKPNHPPEIILWAWERPENLLFIDNKNVKVAFYAGTITFYNSEVIFKPRLQSLVINPETPVIAVIRIVNGEKSDQLNKKQLSRTVDLIIEICSQNKVSGCQIDFDVKSSEINFYKRLIIEVRKTLPRSLPLSITTLISWCHLGSWLESLPIDEVVPMFYRVGLDEYLIRHNLVGKSFMKAKMCQKCIGISVDEPLPPSEYLKNRKIYIFNPQSWTTDDFLSIMIEIKKELSKGGRN